MALRMALLLGACLAACSAGPVQDADPVRLGVYYECLCPDSIAFVKEQLSVTWPLLKDIMEVDINAYGKAHDLPKADGGYTFVCQHGQRECEGDIMLACAKKYITASSTYVDFNICVMSSVDPPTAGKQCAKSLDISYDKIEECSSSIQGEQLLHEVGLKTHSLRPVVDYIPWFTANEEHTDVIQRKVEYHLTKFICDQYAGTPPAACLGQ